jgi:hypothetical protein
MPEMRYYTVTQTRSIEIVANEAEDAGIIATHVFDGDFGYVTDVWGHTVTDVQVQALTIVRKR